MPEIHVHPLPKLMEELAQWLSDTTQKRLMSQPQAAWALSGGSTPVSLYAYLAEHQDLIPWHATRLYLVDDRNVYAQDPLSNYGMLQRSLLDHLQDPPLFTIPWQTTMDPPQALALYRQALAELPKVEGYPQLDIVLLGMGDDGHTASVFPGSPQLKSRDWVAFGPGPQVSRFTLTLDLLSQAHHQVFLVTGSAKAHKVKECLSPSNAMLPAAQVSRNGRDVHWFLDEESAREL